MGLGRIALTRIDKWSAIMLDLDRVCEKARNLSQGNEIIFRST